MTKMVKKCSIDQRFIRKRNTTHKIHILVDSQQTSSTNLTWAKHCTECTHHTMNSKDTYISYVTWVPIWFPHCPTWQWTISLMLLFFQHFWAQITASVFNMHDCCRRFQADKIRVSCTTGFWIGGDVTKLGQCQFWNGHPPIRKLC